MIAFGGKRENWGSKGEQRQYAGLGGRVDAAVICMRWMRKDRKERNVRRTVVHEEPQLC